MIFIFFAPQMLHYVFPKKCWLHHCSNHSNLPSEQINLSPFTKDFCGGGEQAKSINEFFSGPHTEAYLYLKVQNNYAVVHMCNRQFYFLGSSESAAATTGEQQWFRSDQM